MDKFNYIVKTLSRTKRKDYENYVINRLWNKLDDLDIKPVSQQYVKRNNGKYALIDLYFPQLNIGIEVDELYHCNQEIDDFGFRPDELRTEDIVSAIENYKEERIKIFDYKTKMLRSLEVINQNIDDVVARIKKCKETTDGFKPWANEPDLLAAKRKGFITTSDRFSFRVNGEIREFFGLGTESIEKSYYTIDHQTGDHLWLPHLAIENDGGISSATAYGHINLWVDSETILEYVNHDDYTPKQAIQEAKSVEKFKRITFVKSRDDLGLSAYRFVGIFQKTGEIEEKEINGKKLIFRVHRKVSDRVSSNLSKEL